MIAVSSLSLTHQITHGEDTIERTEHGELKKKYLVEKEKEMRGHLTREDFNLNHHETFLSSPNHWVSLGTYPTKRQNCTWVTVIVTLTRLEVPEGCSRSSIHSFIHSANTSWMFYLGITLGAQRQIRHSLLPSKNSQSNWKRPFPCITYMSLSPPQWVAGNIVGLQSEFMK